MEVINPYLGKYSGASVFLNHGKYGPYLNYDNNLYGVLQCFQKPTFKLDDAIKIINFKQQTQKQEEEPKGALEDLDKIITKVKSKKKVLD